MSSDSEASGEPEQFIPLEIEKAYESMSGMMPPLAFAVL
jgi:hypothetical protein